MNLPGWFFAVIAFGMLVGCSDDEEPLQPLPEGTLSGLVTDSQGNAVAGAFINFEYTVLVGDQIVSSPLSASTLVCDSTVTVVIFNHQSGLVRTLDLEDDCVWDGRDSNGDFVPDGPYRYRLTKGEDESETWFVLVQGSLSTRASTFVVTTGQDGRYSLDLADLPIWNVYPGPTEGEATGDYSFGPETAVYAFRGDGTTNHGRTVIGLGSREVPVVVNLTIQ